MTVENFRRVRILNNLLEEVVNIEGDGRNIWVRGSVSIGTNDSKARLTVHGAGPQLGGPRDAAIVGTESTFGAQGFDTAGVRGISDEGHGVQGESINHIGVEGTSDHGTAIYAESQDGIGIWGVTFNGQYAGFFNGTVRVTGFLEKAGGGFRIDHPADPANRYLNHGFVESSDMKNIYDGIVILDSSGSAIVNVPAWVEVLNKDFRYQLTPMGGSAPNLFIADEISNSCFRIAGGVQGMKVSWQLTGIRNDPWAQSNPINPEEEKVDDEKGYYLHPELYNQPEDSGLMWSRYPNVMRAAKERRR